MRILGHRLRLVSPAVLVAAALLVGSVTTASSATPTVTMFDNDASAMVFDPGQALWGFAPTTVTVTAGEAILFVNPASNQHPHTVTSLERMGAPFANQVRVAARFDSSPNQQALLMPGDSFTLDTSSLQPGNYTYFCKLHPWMVAAFTVVSAT